MANKPKEHLSLSKWECRCGIETPNMGLAPSLRGRLMAMVILRGRLHHCDDGVIRGETDFELGNWREHNPAPTDKIAPPGPQGVGFLTRPIKSKAGPRQPTISTREILVFVFGGLSSRPVRMAARWPRVRLRGLKAGDAQRRWVKSR